MEKSNSFYYCVIIKGGEIPSLVLQTRLTYVFWFMTLLSSFEVAEITAGC
jgi:hypothetical protein